MGLITDVKHEVAHLDVTPKALRKFGITVGAVFLLLAWFATHKHWNPTWRNLFLGLGASLMLFGLVLPPALRAVYRYWMTLSFCLGWCMSRVLLTILFFGAMVPVALLGRVLNLPFVRMRQKQTQDTYWLDHKARPSNHHEELF